MLTDILVTC